MNNLGPSSVYNMNKNTPLPSILSSLRNQHLSLSGKGLLSAHVTVPMITPQLICLVLPNADLYI